MNENKKTATLFLRDLPREVKDAFKAHCARRGKSMTETIVQFMRQTVKGKA